MPIMKGKKERSSKQMLNMMKFPTQINFIIPVHNARKFSAVMGATLYKSCEGELSLG